MNIRFLLECFNLTYFQRQKLIYIVCFRILFDNLETEIKELKQKLEKLGKKSDTLSEHIQEMFKAFLEVRIINTIL